MVITTDIALRGGDEKRVERAGAGDGDKQPHAGQVTVRASAKTGTAGAGITVVCSPEMTARMLGTGVRQVWLAEQTLKQRWDIPTGVPLSDAVRIRIPDVGPDISQQSGLVKTGAGNAPDLC